MADPAVELDDQCVRVVAHVNPLAATTGQVMDLSESFWKTVSTLDETEVADFERALSPVGNVREHVMERIPPADLLPCSERFGEPVRRCLSSLTGTSHQAEDRVGCAGPVYEVQHCVLDASARRYQ
jgi:hypothetical protein